jgi:hypothetical protein
MNVKSYIVVMLFPIIGIVASCSDSVPPAEEPVESGSINKYMEQYPESWSIYKADDSASADFFYGPPQLRNKSSSIGTSVSEVLSSNFGGRSANLCPDIGICSEYPEFYYILNPKMGGPPPDFMVSCTSREESHGIVQIYCFSVQGNGLRISVTYSINRGVIMYRRIFEGSDMTYRLVHGQGIFIRSN